MDAENPSTPVQHNGRELGRSSDAALSDLIQQVGPAARFAFGEFLHSRIRNPHTRKS